MTTLPKSYDPRAEEPKVRQRWAENRPFHAVPDAPGDPFCILIPLPNITDKLHLGHALNNTLQDILTRYHRARGFNTLWMPGTDHAGIATQTVVEKRVLAEEGKRRTDFSRDEFVSKILSWKDEFQSTILSQLREMGCSCDWDRTRFTLDDVCAAAVREAFFQLFKEGLIYRGKRLVNWDPATQTALADDEVEMHEVEGYFWYLQYPLIGDPVVIDGRSYDHVTVATTRPETMLGDTAVAMNPRDPRAKHFAGRRIRLPIVNREIPIVVDDYVVLSVEHGGDPDDAKAQYATGFLKVTPAHDPNDWEIGLRHELPIINVLAPDGCVSDQYGWADVGDAEFTLGLDRYEARQAVVEWFRDNHLLEEVKPYTHSVGHSYRSHVAIEPYLSNQWYVAVTKQIPSLPDEGTLPGTTLPVNSLAGCALRAMTKEQVVGELKEWAGSTSRDWEGRLTFYPERYARTFQNWHENIRDWCISRQLWWGHRIPVWSLTSVRFENRDKYNWLFSDPSWESLRSGQQAIKDELKGFFWTQVFADPDDRTMTMYACVAPGHEDMEKKLESEGWQRDPDVLDTWFSSALWPMSTMGWPNPEAFPTEIPEGWGVINKWNPTSVLCTAREIITLWVSRMVMFNLYFLGRLPYSDVFIHAMIQDGEGRKMSKSLGNGVDPRDIIKTKGSDAMRFTLTQMTTQTQDVRMSVEFDEAIGANTSPKFESGRRLCNKLWNATRFALMTLGSIQGAGNPDGTPTRLVDRWMLARLARTVRDIEAAISEYQFNTYAQGLYDLFWRDFCDWYLEAVKPTIASDPTQQSVLRAVLGAIHRMAQPIMPFITESLHEPIESLTVQPIACIQIPPAPLAATARWPQLAGLDEAVTDQQHAMAIFERVQTLVTAIREVRASHQVPDRRRIALHVGDGESAALIEAADGVVESLAGLSEWSPLVSADSLPADRVLFTLAGVEHAVSGLAGEASELDADAEAGRIGKRREELEKQIRVLEGRLGNKGYIDKAPAHLVDETRKQLADARSELERLAAV